MIEFQPWYNAGQQLVRCGGDSGCGALLLDGDAELHTQFHEKVWPTGEGGLLLPRVCVDPDCPIPHKPGRPMHGPHDLIAGKGMASAADLPG